MINGEPVKLDLTLPKNTEHKAHPFNNAANHDKLLTYVKCRLDLGKQYRDQNLSRYARIDREVAGWMKLADEDRRRKNKQDKTGIPQAVTVNLPLAYIQLDDMMTYFAQTFAPTRGMFFTTGKADEQSAANQIVTIMNNHAIYAGYYRPTLQAIFNALKYNIGGFITEWGRDMGLQVGTDDDGNTVATPVTRWQGNRLESVDVYNTFWDPSVHPTEVYSKGEFAGKVWLASRFRLMSLCEEGRYFNCEAALQEDDELGVLEYYRNPPKEAQFFDESRGTDPEGGTNWVSILSGSPEYLQDEGYEIAEIYIRLNPMQFGLLPNTVDNRNNRSRLEIWKITILNGKYIIATTYRNNVHSYIPYFLGMHNDDLMSVNQKSVAEILSPLQTFASFLLNTHVKATRKNIWGFTFYNPSMFNLDAIPHDEVAGRVPMKPEAWDRDIREGLYRDAQPLDTKQTLQDLSSVMEIIERFYPSQAAPSQIAGIDRAIDSQVAAVQQGANRRQQKAARLLDDTMFRPMRFAMYYNILQYQADNTEVTDFYGRVITVNLQEIRNTDLPFIIGQGLKAIDRQTVANHLQTIIFALIQNPETAQRVDILAMIDYWANLIDMDIDMNQFEIKQQQQQQAQQPGAEAAAQPVQPVAAAAQ